MLCAEYVESSDDAGVGIYDATPGWFGKGMEAPDETWKSVGRMVSDILSKYSTAGLTDSRPAKSSQWE